MSDVCRGKRSDGKKGREKRGKCELFVVGTRVVTRVRRNSKGEKKTEKHKTGKTVQVEKKKIKRIVDFARVLETRL